MALTQASTADALQVFYMDLERKHLAPLWTATADLLPREPKTKVLPFLWRWSDLWALAQRSGELIPIERGGERRVLALINPGLPGRYRTSHTLWAAVQYLQPGERAPAHRHTPAAIRWIIKGEGSYTAVDGEKCVMNLGDLVLTPAWCWHDHGNDTQEPMIWMDGLDLPLVNDLDGTFFEPYPDFCQPLTKPENDSEHRYSLGQLKPTWEKQLGPASPLLNYKWSKTYEALKRLAGSGASPFDDVAMEFINPYTGGPALPTMACWIQLIRPAVRTRAHRQTNSAVYQVFEGSGATIINGTRFDWKKGDMFVVPPWSWHEHANPTDSEAILFSIQDTPVMTAFGLYREQDYEANNGHQEVTGSFPG